MLYFLYYYCGLLTLVMKKIVLILIFSVHIAGHGQVMENFTDTDISIDPTWYGNLSAFKVESGKLRSAKSEINSKYYICTPSLLVKNTEWSFNVDLLFNPSNANYLDVFLTSSDSNLLTTPNGYFVRLGGTKDEICLYKKVNGVTTLIIDGQDGLLNKSSNNIKLKITCDKFYKWSIKYDATGVSGVSEVFVDSSLTNSAWFGFSILQSTASFFQKHYFDDLGVSEILKDTTPPKLVNQNFVGSKSFTLKFDEPLDSNWVNNLNNIKLYNRWGDLLPITSVSFTDQKGLFVDVMLKDSIRLQSTYYLTLSNVKDRNGNVIKKDISAFIVYFLPAEAKYKDIVFTEFLVDPVPSTGLPEKEFIEIYNNSNNTIDLAGFTLSDPSTITKLPSYLLLPKTYLIVCKDSDIPDFASFGSTLGLKVIPSLNNADDDIRLLNPKLVLIDEVKYRQAWYNNTLKDDGGYSLEIIDPQNICLGKNNWAASNSSIGGTPGNVNSVYQIIKDSIPPLLTDIIVVKENQIKVVFNEQVDSTLLVKSNFSFNVPLTFKSFLWQKDSLDQITVLFESSLTKNTEYQVQILNVKDCPGNKTDLTGSFILADEAHFGEILINELLFNPYPYGADFVEIYNNSTKVIDLKGWKFANLKNDTVANKSVIFLSTFLLNPYEYLVLTENRQNILNTYIKSRADRIVEVKTLPTFYDDEGSAILINAKDEMIDRFDYSQTMHSPFINNKQGVSLEKLNPSMATTDKSSWTSASKEAGYATPGYINSQNLNLTALEDLVEITPNLITPNQDGDNDIMIIRLKTDKPGSLRNIQIFDIAGRTIKHLERNNYSSTATSIQWDGSDDSNKLVPVGHYIIWIEIVDSEGNINHLKKKVVVGDRF